MSTITTDRIETQVLLHASRARVWRALTDSNEFGTWFEAALTEPFRPGARVRGPITHPDYAHLELDLTVAEMEPERRFSFRWHPNAVDPDQDYSREPMTLVEFMLDDCEGGTLLRLVESGFEHIPPARREEALRSNGEGWGLQMKAIEEYLRRHPS